MSILLIFSWPDFTSSGKSTLGSGFINIIDYGGWGQYIHVSEH